jgi:hypothetical protein
MEKSIKNWNIYYNKTDVTFSLKTRINHRIQKNIPEPTYSVCNSELSKEKNIIKPI